MKECDLCKDNNVTCTQPLRFTKLRMIWLREAGPIIRKDMIKDCPVYQRKKVK